MSFGIKKDVGTLLVGVLSSLEKKGKIISPFDIQIAAHAISENLILVINNNKEFSRIKNIRLENWL